MADKKLIKAQKELSKSQKELKKVEASVKSVEANKKSLKAAIIELVEKDGKIKTINNTLQELEKSDKKVAKNAKLLIHLKKQVTKTLKKITDLESKTEKKIAVKKAASKPKVKKEKIKKDKPTKSTAKVEKEDPKVVMIGSAMPREISNKLLAVDAVAKIQKMSSAEEVNTFVASEKRVTVRRAAEEKIKGL